MSDSDVFYDRVYEAWMCSRDPDAVSRDRFDDLRSQGFAAEEIPVESLLPELPKREEEE